MHTLSTFKPTDNQQKVLAILAANKDKPSVAAQQLTGDANLVGARNLLMNLNIITYSDSGAALTDTGTILATDNGIIDDSGSLTDLGNTLASGNNANVQDNTPIDMDTSSEEGGEEDLMSNLEGFSPLFTSLLFD